MAGIIAPILRKYQICRIDTPVLRVDRVVKVNESFYLSAEELRVGWPGRVRRKRRTGKSAYPSRRKQRTLFDAESVLFLFYSPFLLALCRLFAARRLRCKNRIDVCFFFDWRVLLGALFRRSTVFFL